MIIKEMIEENIPQIAEIEKASFSKPWSEKSITESFLSQSNIFFVAEINGKIVGYIGMTLSIDEGYILNVAVLPQYRKQGVGRKLVESLISFGENNKLVFITLEVRESNIPAISLYTQYGFSQVGKRKNYYSNPSEDALLLTKYFNS